MIMGPEPEEKKRTLFGGYPLCVPPPKSRYRKPRQTKWWAMSLLSIPVMKMLESENKTIDEAKIADLERSVEHKKKLAREHLAAGREGKANKMANRARANEREIAKLKRMI